MVASTWFVVKIKYTKTKNADSTYSTYWIVGIYTDS